MIEGVTVGVVASKALAMAGEVATKGLVGAVVKDAYDKLKQMVGARAANDVEQLVANPTPGREKVVAEVIDSQPQSEREAIQRLVNELTSAVKQIDTATVPIGFDFETFIGGFVDLSDMTVSNGIGFRAKHAEMKELKAPGLNIGEKKT